jgi:hypothetical protein
MTKLEELSRADSCLNRAKDDELVFVLLGRDAAAPNTIRSWVQERVRLGKNRYHDPPIIDALQCAERMERGTCGKAWRRGVTLADDPNAVVRCLLPRDHIGDHVWESEKGRFSFK